VSLDPDREVGVEHDEDLFDGVTTLDLAAVVPDESAWADDVLYQPDSRTNSERVTVRAVPYYAWANRGETEMRVWVDAE